MSLIITRNFKHAKAQDSAHNVKYRGCEITVAYHNPDNVNLPGKTWIVKDVDGVSVGGFSSEAKAKAWIDAHPSRTADSIAADAKFKIGDKVRRGKQTGIVRGIEKEPYIEVKFTDEPVTVFVHESEIKAANSRATDACGTDAKFKERDDVFVKMPDGHEEEGTIVKVYTDHYDVKLWDSGVRAVGFSKVRAMTAADASDAAEFHVGQRVRAKDPRWTGYQGHALGNGIYTVKKVDRDGTVKLDGFLDVWISPNALVEANDAI